MGCIGCMRPPQEERLDRAIGFAGRSALLPIQGKQGKVQIAVIKITFPVSEQGHNGV